MKKRSAGGKEMQSSRFKLFFRARKIFRKGKEQQGMNAFGRKKRRQGGKEIGGTKGT